MKNIFQFFQILLNARVRAYFAIVLVEILIFLMDGNTNNNDFDFFTPDKKISRDMKGPCNDMDQTLHIFETQNKFIYVFRITFQNQ